MHPKTWYWPRSWTHWRSSGSNANSWWQSLKSRFDLVCLGLTRLNWKKCLTQLTCLNHWKMLIKRRSVPLSLNVNYLKLLKISLRKNIIINLEKFLSSKIGYHSYSKVQTNFNWLWTKMRPFTTTFLNWSKPSFLTENKMKWKLIVLGGRIRTPTKRVRGEDLRAGKETHQRTGSTILFIDC